MTRRLRTLALGTGLFGLIPVAAFAQGAGGLREAQTAGRELFEALAEVGARLRLAQISVRSPVVS